MADRGSLWAIEPREVMMMLFRKFPAGSDWTSWNALFGSFTDIPSITPLKICDLTSGSV